MNHLTVDQILEYVSIKRMDADALKLAAEVTTHIRVCPSCLRQVRAYQLVCDGMERQLHDRLRAQLAAGTGTKDTPREPLREHPGIDS